ncbi:FG-GAP-like repeat-containing protein [Microbulbifer sp. JMSA004]|uniref:FG-GAP-like repeat-containing protein n=1 Tax=Microbulbifer sp. JMSA004 TaxID=3243370 RepID=UPI004039A76D
MSILSKSFSKVKNGTYTYQVYAQGEYYNPEVGEYFPKSYSVGSAVSVVVTVPKPGAPGSISAPSSTDTDGSYSVSWTSSSGIVDYYQYRQSKNSSWGSWVGMGSSKSKSFSGMGDGTYKYQARACNDSGCGSSKTSGSFSVLQKPGTPSSITVPSGYNTTGSYNVSWGTASGTVEYYSYRQLKGSSWGAWVNNGTSRTEPFSDQDEAQYQYQVKACNATGCGGTKTSSSFIVLELPSAVTGLSSPVSQVTSSVLLSWNPPSSGSYDEYLIEEMHESGTWIESKRVDAEITEDTLDIELQGDYTFRVSACNAAGCGSTSNTVTVTADAIMVEPSPSEGNYILRWLPYDSENGWQYEITETFNNVSTVLSAKKYETSKEFTKTKNGTYTYWVSQNVDVNGDGSEFKFYDVGNIDVEVILPLPTMVGISVSANKKWVNESVVVSYAPLTNVHVDSYELQYKSTGGWTPINNGDSVTLSNSGTYTFQVRARNDSGPGPWGQVDVEVYEKPEAPKLFVNHIGKDGEVELWWDETAGDADYFQLTSSTDSNFEDPGPLSGTSHTLIDAPVGYQKYQLAACLSKMNDYCSDYSEEAMVYVFNFDENDENLTVLAAATEDSLFSIPSDENVAIWEGDISVNGGAVNYNFPVALPPGRNGMAPSLSVSYSSQSGYGNLGFGWSIGTGGAVSRCQKTFAIDGKSTPVQFDSSDKLCLNGQRLILVSGSYGQSGAVYATEIYDGSEITQKGGAISSSSSYFEVETKNNQILTFGGGNNAVFVPSGTSAPMAWKQAWEEDAFGNNIAWKYQTVSGEHRLDAIYYTGYQGAYGSREVDFIYETANRYRSQFVHGAEVVSASRLEKLKIYINGAAGHEYRFDYANDSAIDRLVSLSYCPTGSNCTVNDIEWGQEESLLGSDIPAVDIEPNYVEHEDGLATQAVGGRDFDGDGLFDIWARDQGIYLSSEQQWVDYPEINDLKSLSNQFDESRIDINLDGRDDLLFTTSDKKLKYATWDSSSSSFKFVDTGIQSKCEYILAVPANPAARAMVNFCESAASDIDGDGAIDILMPDEQVDNYTYTYNLYRNNAGTLVKQAQFEAGAFGAISMKDLDGDGVKDVLVSASLLKSDNKIYWYKVTDINGSWSVGAEQTITVSGLVGNRFSDGRSTIKWADVNGDGLQDLLALSTPNDLEYEWYYALNKGNGSFTSFASTGLEEFASIRTMAGNTSNGAYAWNHLAFAVDINHDGIEDLMAPSRTTYKALCDNGSYQNNPCNIDTELEAAPVQYDVYKWSAYIATYDESGLSYTEQDLGIQSHQENLFQADVNGDGVTDYGAYLGASGKTYTYRGPTPGVYLYLGNRSEYDLVSGIKLADERIERHRINYATLVEQHDSGSRIFTPNSEAQSYPYTNFINGMRIVKSVESDNGVGGFNEERYTYKGAVAHLKGRGFAGFGQITREEMTTGNRDISTFYQAFPYTGILESRQQYSGDDILFYDYQVNTKKNSFGQPSGTYLPRVTKDTTKEYEIGDNGLAATVTNTSDYDSLGNQVEAILVEVDPYGRSSQTTTAEFSTSSSCRNTPVYSQVVSQRNNYDVGVGSLNTTDQDVRSDFSSFENCAPKRTEITASGSTLTKAVVLSFDQYGNVLSSTKQGGSDANRVATNVYDSEGYFVESTYNNEWGSGARSYQTTNPWFGTVVSATDPLNRQADTTLNDFGQPLTVTSDAAPTVKSRRAWCDGSCPQDALQKSVTWSLGSPPVTEYLDSLGRTLRTETLGFDGRTVVANKEYDQRGNLVRTEEPHYDGATTTYETWSEFDDMNRAGKHERYSNPLSFTTTYTYSRTGVAVDVVNGDGASLSMFKAFAANKKLVYTQDAKGGKTYYRYDGAGRLVSLVDAAANDIRYEYNGFGEAIAVDDPNSGRSSFEYNAFGERTVSTDANNQVTDTFYDKLGRVTGTVNNGDTIARLYDQNGHYGLLTTEARNEEYIRLFEYQSGTYHPAATYTVIDEAKAFLEKTAWDTTYHRPTVTRAADGEIFRSRYNSRGHAYQHQHYQADQSWVTTWTLTDTTASGAPVIQQFMGGIEQKISRYAGSDIIDGICAGGVNCLQSDQIQSIDYRHNAWGSVTGEAHQHNGLDYAYSYDTLHRLESQTVTSSDYPHYDRSVSYTYDAVGNLTSKSDYATSLSYGNSARSAGGNAGPHAVRQVTTTDGQSHSLVYDNAGNLITGIDGLSVGYDNYNQANRIERNGIVTEYFYGTGIDAYKKIETEGSNVTTTLYIGNYEEITTDSATKERTTHGGYLVITRENETIEQSILLKDRLGSITTIVDANLQPGDSDFVRQFRSYDPFGQSRDFQGQDNLDSFNTTDQGFTGHRHLNDQQLIHMRGRVYDYQLGRFLSPDPIILDPQDSQSLNAYSYVMNNPLAAVDPTGYAAEGGDTGQKPNGRSKSEDNPTTESGQKAVKTKTVYKKLNNSRIKIPVGKVPVGVDGNGGSISVSSIAVGQEAITDAGEGSRSGGQSNETIISNDGPPYDDIPTLPTGNEPSTINYTEYNLKNAGREILKLFEGMLPVEGVIAGGAAKLGSFLFIRNATVATKSAGQVGRAGEEAVQAAFEIGKKQKFTINGRNRIPDGVTSTTLSEVKNVASLSYTRQLRDFADIAKQQGLQYDLYVRPSTKLSGPLTQAIQDGVVNLKFIPGAN